MVKNLKINFRGNSVRRFWTAKTNSFELYFLNIPSLRDRILQTIVYMSLFPIVEWRGDLHSFGFRPKRSTVQSITILADQLKIFGNVKPYKKNLFTKIIHETYSVYSKFHHCS